MQLGSPGRLRCDLRPVLRSSRPRALPQASWFLRIVTLGMSFIPPRPVRAIRHISTTNEMIAKAASLSRRRSACAGGAGRQPVHSRFKVVGCRLAGIAARRRLAGCRLACLRSTVRGVRSAAYGVRFTDNGSRLALMAGETPPACPPGKVPTTSCIDVRRNHNQQRVPEAPRRDCWTGAQRRQIRGVNRRRRGMWPGGIHQRMSPSSLT